MEVKRVTKPSHFIRIVSTGLSLVLFTTQCLFAHKPESNVWEERRKSIQLAQVSLGQRGYQTTNFPTHALIRRGGPRLPCVSSALSDLVSSLSGEGVVSDIKLARQSHSVKEPPVVIYIQDVHGQLEAQKNIAAMVLKVLTQHPQALVGLEGAAGKVPIENFRRSSLQINKEVGTFFLNTGVITGAECAGFAALQSPTLYGIEDPELYLKNLAAVRAALPQQKNHLAHIEKENSRLQLKKLSLYSPALLALDQKRRGYHEGTVNMGDYLSHLNANVSASLADFPNIALFMKTWPLEKTLNFDLAEQERDRSLAQLVGKLSPSEQNGLIQQSLALKSGVLPYPNYYRLIQETANKVGISLSQTPEFNRYITYVLQVDAIHPESLLAEISKFEETAYTRLYQTQEQRRLVQDSFQLELKEKLVRLKLTPQEWEKYKSTPSPVRSEASFKSFESFYEAAEARNAALSTNLKNKLFETSAPLSILVAGGFHTMGLRQLLADGDITFINVTPKLSKGEGGSDNEYLNVFTREKTPLEQLFEAPKISMVETLKTCPIPGAKRAHLDPKKVLELGQLLEAVHTSRLTPIEIGKDIYRLAGGNESQMLVIQEALRWINKDGEGNYRATKNHPHLREGAFIPSQHDIRWAVWREQGRVLWVMLPMVGALVISHYMEIGIGGQLFAGLMAGLAGMRYGFLPKIKAGHEELYRTESLKRLVRSLAGFVLMGMAGGLLLFGVIIQQQPYSTLSVGPLIGSGFLVVLMGLALYDMRHYGLNQTAVSNPGLISGTEKSNDKKNDPIKKNPALTDEEISDRWKRSSPLIERMALRNYYLHRYIFEHLAHTPFVDFEPEEYVNSAFEIAGRIIISRPEGVEINSAIYKEIYRKLNSRLRNHLKIKNRTKLFYFREYSALLEQSLRHPGPQQQSRLILDSEALIRKINKSSTDIKREAFLGLIDIIQRNQVLLLENTHGYVKPSDMREVSDNSAMGDTRGKDDLTDILEKLMKPFRDKERKMIKEVYGEDIKSLEAHGVMNRYRAIGVLHKAIRILKLDSGLNELNPFSEGGASRPHRMFSRHLRFQIPSSFKIGTWEQDPVPPREKPWSPEEEDHLLRFFKRELSRDKQKIFPAVLAGQFDINKLSQRLYKSEEQVQHLIEKLQGDLRFWFTLGYFEKYGTFDEVREKLLELTNGTSSKWLALSKKKPSGSFWLNDPQYHSKAAINETWWARVLVPLVVYLAFFFTNADPTMLAFGTFVSIPLSFWFPHILRGFPYDPNTGRIDFRLTSFRFSEAASALFFNRDVAWLTFFSALSATPLGPLAFDSPTLNAVGILAYGALLIPLTIYHHHVDNPVFKLSLTVNSSKTDVTLERDEKDSHRNSQQVALYIAQLAQPFQRHILGNADYSGANRLLNQRLASQLGIISGALSTGKNGPALQPLMANATFLAGRAGLTYRETHSILNGLETTVGVHGLFMSRWFTWARGWIVQLYVNVLSGFKTSFINFKDLGMKSNALIGIDVDVLLTQEGRQSEEGLSTLDVIEKYLKRSSQYRGLVMSTHYIPSANSAQNKLVAEQRAEFMSVILRRNFRGIVEEKSLSKIQVISLPQGFNKPDEIRDIGLKKLKITDKSVPFRFFTLFPERYNMNGLGNLIQVFSILIGGSVAPLSDRIKTARVYSIGA